MTVELDSSFAFTIKLDINLHLITAWLLRFISGKHNGVA